VEKNFQKKQKVPLGGFGAECTNGREKGQGTLGETYQPEERVKKNLGERRVVSFLGNRRERINGGLGIDGPRSGEREKSRKKVA